jgi:hypothetical protein
LWYIVIAMLRDSPTNSVSMPANRFRESGVCMLGLWPGAFLSMSCLRMFDKGMDSMQKAAVAFFFFFGTGL